MIRILIISLSCLFILTAFSSKKKDITPPGTVKLSENLFIDQNEVSQFSWLEYIYWIEKNNGKTSKAYYAILPDSNIVSNESLHDPLNRNLPIVGITYLQAIEYSKWRSKRVNEFIYIQKNKIKYSPDSTYKNIPQIYNYRLPSEEEFNMAATVGFSEKTTKQMTKESRKRTRRGHPNVPKFNTNHPNMIGVFNIRTGINEMINKEGKYITIDMLSSNTLSKMILKPYLKPEKWLGFRCVCDQST